MRSLGLTALAIFSLAGCGVAEEALRSATAAPPTGAGAIVQTTEASWRTDATEYRGRSGTFAFDCPPNPSRSGVDRVWGSDPYTDDSAVCHAAVHAGAITFERGGRVTIAMRPGQNRYAGSTRNGATTRDYRRWPGSFTVLR